MANSLGDKIAKLSLEKFSSLPKTGKPKESEWTILSSIVKEQNSICEVVSIGTGSKCIGKLKMCPKGTIVNDSHAEIMCRRAFLRYLYSQLGNNSIIFSLGENGTFTLKPGVKFHFFTTQVPCGDAAIFPQEKYEDAGTIIEDNASGYIPAKKRKLKDIFRTGAKCLKDDIAQDPKTEGCTYHIVGVVRTKPGRGDPTASVSCSDKFAKWCHLGIQGALLMSFLSEPVYLSSFTILRASPFCQKSLERALFERTASTSLVKPYQKHMLEFYTADYSFAYRRTESRLPCSSSICWHLQNDQNLEVAVNGRKQGATKKHYLSEKGRLKICKLELFKTFKEKLLELNKDLGCDIETCSYGQAKMLSKSYQSNWSVLKQGFGAWSSKDPEFSHFLGS